MSLNLYLTGLPLTWSNDNLRTAFDEIGHVESCKVLVDNLTKQSRGIGFVKFEKPEHAVAAINAFNGRLIDGHTISIKYAANKTNPAFHQSDTASPPRTPRRINPLSPSMRQRSADISNEYHMKTMSPHDKDVYLACFPQTYTAADLVRLCSPYGKCTAKLLMDSTSGKSRGCGFVKFARIEDAHAAIAALNGSIVEGSNETRPLQVRFAARKNSQDTTANNTNQISPQMAYATLNMQQPLINPYDMTVNPSLPMMYPMPLTSPISYDLLNQSLNSPFSMGLASPPFYPYPESWQFYTAMTPTGHHMMSPTNASMQPNQSDALTLFVCNLPSHYMDMQLSAMFAQYGNVTQARVVRGPQGESRGFGFVSFTNDAECNYAIAALNGMPVDNQGKTLHVAWRKPSNYNQSNTQSNNQSNNQTNKYSQASSPQPSDSDLSGGYVSSESPETIYQQSAIVA